MLILSCTNFFRYRCSHSLSWWSIHHLFTSKRLLDSHLRITLTICINCIICRLIRRLLVFWWLAVGSILFRIRLLIFWWIGFRICRRWWDEFSFIALVVILLLLVLKTLLICRLRNINALTVASHASILLVSIISCSWRFYFGGRLQTTIWANIFCWFARGTWLPATTVSLS